MSARKFYLFVLAGVPASIFHVLTKKLNVELGEKYDGSVAKFVGWPTPDEDNPNKVIYTESSIRRMFELLEKYAFPGAVGRPHGYCPLPNRNCSLVVKERSTCKKADATGCHVQKPHSIILLYHQGKNWPFLLKKFDFSAYSVVLPYNIYKKQVQSFQVIANIFAAHRNREAQINRQLTALCRSTPLLLPLKNFLLSEDVEKFLHSVCNHTDGFEAKIEVFRRKYWNKQSKGFIDSRGLLFKAEEIHGKANESKKIDFRNDNKSIINRYYRLGQSYQDGFHYNVRWPNGGKIDSVEFICSINGNCHAKNEYINIYPTDFIRGQVKYSRK